MKKIIITLLTFVSMAVNAATYYLSNTGNDNANGTSISTPWATIDELNSHILYAGDSILFKAGDIFRGTVVINASGTAGNFIVYSRYGTGENPIICPSEIATGWTTTGTTNVWQSNNGFQDFSTQYYPGRIFFLDNDSISWGQYKGTTASSCTQEYDYAVSGSTYYCYAATDPNTRYDAIEVTQERRSMQMSDGVPRNYIEVNGIDMRFGRLAGFSSGYPEERGYHDLVFRNCTIGYIGAQPSGYAYGIEAWQSNFMVENCHFSDCGRRAISMNLYVSNKAAGTAVHINNVIIRNNTFKRGYHTTGLDLSAQNTTTDTIENVYVYNNIFDDSDFETICDGCTSNMVFVQAGSGASRFNNIYVVSNLFVEATARAILFEGSDTSYVWNNTIIGHHRNLTVNPYNDVVWNSDETEAYYRNNILYDNIGQNDLQNHGVFMYYTYTGKFIEKDYNLYFSLYPGYGGNRNFSAHRINSTDAMGYWTTNDWANYKAVNTLFEQHSPTPQNPDFVNYNTHNYHLLQESSAVGSGLATRWIIVTDPFGVRDTINKTDIDGNDYIIGNWDMGAYAYSAPDLTSNDIVSFTIPGQSFSTTINNTNHTVSLIMPYGTNLTALTPTITVSQAATINPLSGVSRNFTNPVTYTVTGGNGTSTQIWTITVGMTSPSTGVDILTFTIPNQRSVNINNTTHTIDVQMPYGTSATNLTPIITISNNATLYPSSGVSQNFINPIIYTVLAQDGITQQYWTATVTIDPYPIIKMVLTKYSRKRILIRQNDGSHKQLIQID
jgi:hypothetical protein